jgi:hypothetical protein
MKKKSPHRREPERVAGIKAGKSGNSVGAGKLTPTGFA